MARIGLLTLVLIGALAVLCSSATAQRASVFDARAFIGALNSPDRSDAVRLLAPTVRFATADNPWVVFRGRARYNFVSSTFGGNCAPKAIGATFAGPRVVRVRVVLRAAGTHRCIGGQQGVRVLFTIRFTHTAKIASLRITDR